MTRHLRPRPVALTPAIWCDRPLPRGPRRPPPAPPLAARPRLSACPPRPCLCMHMSPGTCELSPGAACPGGHTRISSGQEHCTMSDDVRMRGFRVRAELTEALDLSYRRPPARRGRDRDRLRRPIRHQTYTHRSTCPAFAAPPSTAMRSAARTASPPANTPVPRARRPRHQPARPPLRRDRRRGPGRPHHHRRPAARRRRRGAAGRARPRARPAAPRAVSSSSAPSPDASHGRSARTSPSGQLFLHRRPPPAPGTSASSPPWASPRYPVAAARRRLLVTGDELVPPGTTPSPYQILDSNSVAAGRPGRARRRGCPTTMRARDGEAGPDGRPRRLACHRSRPPLVAGATSVGLET